MSKIRLPRGFIISLLLAVLTFAVFWPVHLFEFLSYDDQQYTYQNIRVCSGLTWPVIKWAFSTSCVGQWMPLTWISHIVTTNLFGLNPGLHHLVNVVFHTGSAVLFFIVFVKMIGVVWPSVLVAVLFALHPLHVESVAWISERKDVLYTLFWALSLWAYIKYVRRPSAGHYLTVLLLYILGLMAKPMAITLPLVLLLLDYWPLGRNGIKLFVEKVPFFLIAAIYGKAVLFSQMRLGAVQSVDSYPFDVRLINALFSYATYISKVFWPIPLAFFYPHPRGAVPTLNYLAAGVLLALIFALAVLWHKRWPHLIVGWFWYLGTLLPVIGFIQVEGQAMADRYTYVPLVGIFMILSWSIYGLNMAYPKIKNILLAVVGISLIMMVIVTGDYLHKWHDSETLFNHALEVTKDNYMAHYNLGDLYSGHGKSKEAAAHFEEAVRIHPEAKIFSRRLFNEYMKLGLYRQALEIDLKATPSTQSDPKTK